MKLIVLTSSHLHTESSVYVLAPETLADPEMLISQCIHDEFVGNPAYSWLDLAKRLTQAGFQIPSEVMVSEKYWDSPQSNSDDAFFVQVPAEAEHEYAGKRMDVITNASNEFGFAMLVDDRGQNLYSHDLVRKLDADHEVGDSFDQVPIGKLNLPVEQFGSDKKAEERARLLLDIAGFEIA